MYRSLSDNADAVLHGWRPAVLAVLAAAIMAGTCGYMSWLLGDVAPRAMPIEALKASTYSLVTLAVAAGGAGGGLSVAASLLLRSARPYPPEESGVLFGMLAGVVAELLFAWHTGSGEVFGPVLAGVLFGGGGAVMSASLFTSFVVLCLPASSDERLASAAR